MNTSLGEQEERGVGVRGPDPQVLVGQGQRRSEATPRRFAGDETVLAGALSETEDVHGTRAIGLTRRAHHQQVACGGESCAKASA